MNLPAHDLTEQVCVFILSPVHFFPPYSGGGLLQYLLLCWYPTPQVFEHLPQAPQFDHPPFTANRTMVKNRTAFFKNVKTLLFESGLFLFFFLFSAFWALFSTELILIIGWLRVLRIYNIQQGPLDRCTTMSFSNVALNACVISFSPISYR